MFPKKYFIFALILISAFSVTNRVNRLGSNSMYVSIKPTLNEAHLI